MGDSHKLVLAYVAPALGTVLANVMFSSPMPAVIGARKEGALGPLNPVPFPIIMANTLAWLVFAVTLQDWCDNLFPLLRGAQPNEIGMRGRRGLRG